MADITNSPVALIIRNIIGNQNQAYNLYNPTAINDPLKAGDIILPPNIDQLIKAIDNPSSPFPSQRSQVAEIIENIERATPPPLNRSQVEQIVYNIENPVIQSNQQSQVQQILQGIETNNPSANQGSLVLKLLIEQGLEGPVTSTNNPATYSTNLTATSPELLIHSTVDDAMRNIERGQVKDRMSSLGLVETERTGAFTRPNDTGKYYWQADNSVYYTGGEVTYPNGIKETKKPATLSGNVWKENLDKPLPGTFAIAALDLIPSVDGTLIKYGTGNTGRYFTQRDGSIYYEGGTINGQHAAPQTYANGKWNVSLTTPQSNSDLIAKYKLIPKHDGTWVHPENAKLIFYPKENSSMICIGKDEKGKERIWIVTLASEKGFIPHPSSDTLLAHGCIPSPDGSWTSPKYPRGKYFLQEDGSLIYQGPDTTGKKSVYLADEKGNFKHIPCNTLISESGFAPTKGDYWKHHIDLTGISFLKEDGTLIYEETDSTGKTNKWELNKKGEKIILK